MEEDILKLKKRMQENKKSLSIARLPDKTKEDFVNFAREEFCDDYGMAFRDVWQDAKLFRKIKEMIFSNKLKLVFEK